MTLRGMKIVPIIRRFVVSRHPYNNCLTAPGQWNRHFGSGRSLVPDWFPNNADFFSNRMRQIDREMNRVFDELQQMSSIMPRFLDIESHSRSRNIPVIRAAEDGGRMYRIDVELHGLEPEDIQVTLKNNILKIRGKKEEVKDGSRYHRHYSYQFTVPAEVNPDTVRSFLDNGVLKIEAPLPKLEEPKEIPIGKDED